jgi:hypothetical protein
MQRDHAYLRTLVGELVQTRAVIERATLACTVSNHLLEGLDRAAVELPAADQSDAPKRPSDRSARARIVEPAQREVRNAPRLATTLQDF